MGKSHFVKVDYGESKMEIPVPDDAVVAICKDPTPLSEPEKAFRRALENPTGIRRLSGEGWRKRLDFLHRARFIDLLTACSAHIEFKGWNGIGSPFILTYPIPTNPFDSTASAGWADLYFEWFTHRYETAFFDETRK